MFVSRLRPRWRRQWGARDRQHRPRRARPGPASRLRVPVTRSPLPRSAPERSRGLPVRQAPPGPAPPPGRGSGSAAPGSARRARLTRPADPPGPAAPEPWPQLIREGRRAAAAARSLPGYRGPAALPAPPLSRGQLLASALNGQRLGKRRPRGGSGAGSAAPGGRGGTGRAGARRTRPAALPLTSQQAGAPPGRPVVPIPSLSRPYLVPHQRRGAADNAEPLTRRSRRRARTASAEHGPGQERSRTAAAAARS